MAVGIASETMLTDGDAAFLRVNNRKPAHALQPGEVAQAVNCRLEQGKPRPRFGVAMDDWGRPVTYTDLLASASWTTQAMSGASYYQITGLTVGASYRLTVVNATALSTSYFNVAGILTPSFTVESWTVPTTYEFEATQATYYLWAATATSGSIADVLVDLGEEFDINTLAYERFNDPGTDTDNGILITDEWRTEDSGRGRAWRIYPGNAPQEIPLNGHDVWDRCQLVACRDALVLFREGDERHYFAGSNLDGTTDEITLNCAPSWPVGESRRVRFELASDGAAIFGTTPPAAGNYYYARHFASNIIKLYQGAADAAADTNALDFDTAGAIGRFYIQLAESPVPFFGNAAPNLIMEGDEFGTPGFEIGFDAVPENVAVTGTSSSVVTAPNHRFVPGDAVTPSGLTIGTAGPYYAYPLNAHELTLHTSATDALTGISPVSSITPAGTGSIKKTNASGLPLPPCRTGAYVNGRLFGVNGRDTIIFSDVNDPLHCTLYQSTLPANQGEAGRVNWILPLGEDAIIIGKDLKLLVLAGIGGATNTWTEGTITGEYGGIAALAADNVGTDAWFLSRKGVASVVRTVAGEKLGVPRTVSQDIPKELEEIDWGRARLACSGTWNGRYFISVPTKGQTDPVNNRTLVLNFLNQSLAVAQDAVAGEVMGGVQETGGAVDSWEGRWEGELLTPFAYARLTVAGDERLTFATPDGMVCWLHDGFDDAGAAIESSITTRGYFGGREMLVLRGKVNWESFNPKVTVAIVTAGVNEEETLAGFDELEYDRTQYLTDGTADYDPDTSTTTQFDAPHRQDYSPTAAELTVARLDVHQHLSEPFRCRVRGSSPQLRITNTQGSLRLESVSIQARPAGTAATRKT